VPLFHSRHPEGGIVNNKHLSFYIFLKKIISIIFSKKIKSFWLPKYIDIHSTKLTLISINIKTSIQHIRIFSLYSSSCLRLTLKIKY
jgi:hypothetical protein